MMFAVLFLDGWDVVHRQEVEASSSTAALVKALDLDQIQEKGGEWCDRDSRTITIERLER